MQVKAINLTSAIILLNEAIEQPVSLEQGCEKISSEERRSLYELRKRLSAISKTCQMKLHLESQLEFDQDKIIKELAARLKTVQEEALHSLQAVLVFIQEEQKALHSQQYHDCLSALFSLLRQTSELLASNRISNIETLEKLFGDDLVYKLSKINGALYIPINQALDPFFGGKEENGKIEDSSGECGGKVISWIESCSQRADIRYPFYAGKFDKIHQQTQAKIGKHYTDVLIMDDINRFCDVCFDKLNQESLYFLKISNGKEAHAIGIRIRQDGVYELFDPNYFHLFSANKKSLQLILKYLLASYYVSWGFSKTILTKADVSQYDSKQGCFPHKTHIIQAAALKNSEVDQRKFYYAITSLIKQANSLYLSDPQKQQEIQSVLTQTIKSLIDAVDYPNILNRLSSSIAKMETINSFLGNEDNKQMLQKMIADRLTLVKTNDYQLQLKEAQLALEEIKKIQDFLTGQINELRSNFASNKVDAAGDRQVATQKLLILTRKSLTVWHLQNKLRNYDASAAIKSRNNQQGVSAKEALTKILTEIFHIENSGGKPILPLVQESLAREMHEIQERFSRYPVSNSSLRLVLAAENLLVLLDKLATENERVSSIKFLRARIKELKKEVQQIINDAKLYDDVSLLERKMNNLLGLDSAKLEVLQNPKNNFDSIRHHFHDLLLKNVREDELLTELREADSKNHSQEIQALAKSMQRIIQYLELLKAEFITENRQILGSKSRVPVQFVLRGLRRFKLATIDSRLKDLIAIKNTLLKECLDKDNVPLFLELSARVRKAYPKLLPVDFNLVQDYARELDAMLGRNKPVIMSVVDRAIAQRLNDSFQCLRLCINECYRRLERIRICLLAGTRFNDLGRLPKGYSERELIDEQLQMLNATIDIGNHLLNVCEDDEEIIGFAACLMPFVKGNSFDVNAFLVANSKMSEGHLRDQDLLNKPAAIKQFTNPLEELLASKQLARIIRKINELVERIYSIDKKIAVQVLHAANVELAHDGCSIVNADYGLQMSKHLQQVGLSHLSNDLHLALRGHILTLNHLFQGQNSSHTEALWKAIGLEGDLNSDQGIIRQQYGIMAFKYFREICVGLEQVGLLQQTDQAHIKQP